MAFQIRKIDPLDLQPRKAIGVQIPFSGKAVFNQTYQSRDAIRNNLINFFLTGKGERYFNPNFGTGLRNFLFENIGRITIKQVDATLRRELQLYFPTVIVQEMELTGDPDTNTITFFIKYAVSDTNIEDEIVINIEQ